VQLECGNLAVCVVGWAIPDDSSTISRHDELVIRELKNNDRSRLDLGMCGIDSEETTTNKQQQSSHYSSRSLRLGGELPYRLY
jgi:hypothetical protein